MAKEDVMISDVYDLVNGVFYMYDALTSTYYDAGTSIKAKKHS